MKRSALTSRLTVGYLLSSMGQKWVCLYELLSGVPPYQARSTRKLEAVIHYCSSRLKCRSQILLSYFGEEYPQRCGQCDVCLERNKLDLSEIEFDSVIAQLKPILMKELKTYDEAIQMIKGISEERIINAIRWLMDNDKIEANEDGKLFWKK